jgi:hypothetical protein
VISMSFHLPSFEFIDTNLVFQSIFMNAKV